MTSEDSITLAGITGAALLFVACLFGACCALPVKGNPRCFAVDNCANGSLAEDPKCGVGPCEPGQHGEGEGE